jgi:hypothetical protein
MARGRWEDFADKYGFNDGESVDTLDFAARDFLVRALNHNRVMQEKRLRAVAYEFAGVHNGARILILKDEGRVRGRSRVYDAVPRGTQVLSLPDELKDEVDDLVDASYDEAWDKLIQQKTKDGKRAKKSTRKR